MLSLNWRLFQFSVAHRRQYFGPYRRFVISGRQAHVLFDRQTFYWRVSVILLHKVGTSDEYVALVISVITREVLR